jgi:hypothetical protein
LNETPVRRSTPRASVARHEPFPDLALPEVAHDRETARDCRDRVFAVRGASPRSRRRFAREKWLAGLVAAVLATWVVPIAAQSPLAGRSAATGVGFESYRFAEPVNAGIESVSLISVPATARARLFGPLTLQLRGGFASGSLVTATGSEVDLSGPIDTEVQLGVNLGSGPFSTSVAGIFVAPTGTSRHSPEEAILAAFVGSDFLPFRVRNWGMGGAAGVSLTAARSFGGGSLGFGAGYIATREYTPFQTADAPAAHDFVYRPGNQLQLRFAADRNLTSASKLAVALVFERSDEDLLDDENLYRSGNRYQAMASYAFAAGARSTAILYAGGLLSDEGVALNPALNNDFTSRSLILAGGGMRVPMGRTVFVPSIDARVFRRGSGLGQGYLTGIGAAFEIPAGGFALSPTARYRLGKFVASEDVESRVTGFDLGLEIRFGR